MVRPLVAAAAAAAALLFLLSSSESSAGGLLASSLSLLVENIVGSGLLVCHTKAMDSNDEAQADEQTPTGGGEGDLSLPSAVFALGNATPSLLDHHFFSRLVSRRLERRELPMALPCNQELSESFSRDELMQAHLFYLNVLLQGNEELIQTEMKAFASALRYGARVYKLCASCRDLAAGTDVEALYPPACGASVYGHDALHSAVVMVPVDETTRQIVSGHRLRGFLRMHASLGPYEVPTELWPQDGVRRGWLSPLSENPGNETVVAKFAASAASFIAAMTAASAGAVSILPDYLGYGESRSTHNRTVAFIPHYQQAAVVSWRGAQELLQNLTGGCTVLDDVATVNGFSEGGFASVAGAIALQETGVRVLKLFVNAPFLDLENETLHMLRYAEEGLIDVTRNSYGFRLAIPFGIFCYSAETPGLANTGTGQALLHPDWADPANFTRNVIGWFQSPNPLTLSELGAVVPEDPLIVVNTEYIALLRLAFTAGVPSPCRSEFVRAGVTDKLCEAVLAGSVRTILMNATFPIGLCYSPDDSYVDPAQFDAELFSSPHVTRLGGPGGIDVRGDHWATGFSCGHNTIEFLAGRDRPEKPDEQGTFISPIEGGGQNCAAEGSSAPTDAPPTPTQTTASASASARSSWFSMYSWMMSSQLSFARTTKVAAAAAPSTTRWFGWNCESEVRTLSLVVSLVVPCVELSAYLFS
jgi:hypothetical protein